MNIIIKKRKKKKERKKMAEEKRPLLLKIDSTKNRYPPPEPFPERPPNPTPHQIFSPRSSPCSPPFLPPCNSPTKREKFWDFFKEKDEQQKIVKKLVFGEYESLNEMATKANGGQKSDLIEKNPL